MSEFDTIFAKDLKSTINKYMDKLRKEPDLGSSALKEPLTTLKVFIALESVCSMISSVEERLDRLEQKL